MHDSRISKLWSRIWGAQVLHDQGCGLLIESRLPLHQRLIQELDSITAKLGLFLPVHQAAITESACAQKAQRSGTVSCSTSCTLYKPVYLLQASSACMYT